MKKQPSITIRPNKEEHAELKRRAAAANMSINRYVLEAALNSAPREDKKMSELMGQLCRLEVGMQRASGFKELKNYVHEWKMETVHILAEE